MTLVRTFVENPVKVAVAVLMVALFGVISLFRLPIQLTPEVQVPMLTVETRWPGASPEEIEREIVQEQEEQLKSVESLVKLSSECQDSLGRVILEFSVGTDMSEALVKVNARLQQVREYPADADEPVITTSNASDTPIAWFILRPRVCTREQVAEFQKAHPELAAALEPVRKAHNSGLRLARLRRICEQIPAVRSLLPPDIDVTELRRFAEDTIESRFERVGGVSNSNVLGGREEELQVVVDPQRLAARQITIQDLRNALVARNRDTSGGDFWDGKRRFVVRTLGRFRSPEDVESAIVTTRAGSPVYVRDIAEVHPGHKKADSVVRNFGTLSLAINAQRTRGANVLEVMAGLRVANRELNEGILKDRGLQLEQVYDETEYIDSAVGLVQENILYGGILTILILLLFLRSGRSTLLLALAIPTSIVGTFLVLALLGRSLNVVSLAGLAFAVGMLVDNAVVVLENVYRHRQEGKSPLDAAIIGTTEVWGAVVASTLTTLAVFLPVLFVKEDAGQLFADIALAISAAVGLSMVVAGIVIPVAASRLLQASSVETLEGRASGSFVRKLLLPLDASAGRFVRAILAINRWLHRSAIRSVACVLAMTAASVLASWAMIPKVEYLPGGNRNLIFAIVLPPPGYNLDELTRLGETIEQRLQKWWDVDLEGPTDPGPRDFPAVSDFFYVAFGRQVFAGLRAADPLRAAELVGVVQGVTSDLPGTFAIARQSSLFEQGLTAGRTIDVEISGPDLPRLIDLGRGAFFGAMMAVPGAQVFPKPSLDLSNPEVHILPRWEKAQDLRLNAADLGYSVDAFVDGAYAGDYFIGGDKIDLSIVGAKRYAKSALDLEQIPIVTPAGQVVPLAAAARVEVSSGAEQINHRERQRTITVQVAPPDSMALEDALEKVQAAVVAPLRADPSLGSEYRVHLSGTADKLRATWESLRFNVLLALLITYLLMAALFESWLDPLVVIFSVPLGAVGGLAGLYLLNRFVVQPLDVLTMLGFVILIGTVVNNPILIVHQSLVLMREHKMPLDDAVLESVRTRIRPIFMTTVTTVIGLVPLVVSPGAGSELYRGLGGVLLGGLSVSTLFTLVLVPTLFHLVYRIRGAARSRASL